ncbi:MAG: hypothetical protein AB199_02710 [Parcubacteria bacterium C7867-004]|nr:MAG: hypothetical protein AB199_02710 [Parcubacteria bacterium C7867-004]
MSFDKIPTARPTQATESLREPIQEELAARLDEVAKMNKMSLEELRSVRRREDRELQTTFFEGTIAGVRVVAWKDKAQTAAPWSSIGTNSYIYRATVDGLEVASDLDKPQKLYLKLLIANSDYSRTYQESGIPMPESPDAEALADQVLATGVPTEDPE